MAWYDDWSDFKDGAGDLVKKMPIYRAAEGVGLISPDDQVNEQGAMAPATVASDEVLRRALEQQNLLNQGIQTGSDITKFSAGYGGPATITPERVEGVAPQQQIMADWKQALPVERITAAQTAPGERVEMGQVNTNVTGPGIMQAQQANAAQAGRATVDPLANELRGEQLDAARALATGPSVADAKFRAGLAATAEEQLGLVAGARGAERAGLRAEAVRQMAAKGVQGAALGAAASAQEELAKKQALASALSGMRGQDADVSMAQASLDAQRNSLNAQLATATSQGNAQQVNAIRTQQAQLEQAAKTNTAQLGLSAATSAADIANANANRQAQIALSNTGATNTANATNAASANALSENNANRQTQASQFNASQGNTIGANALQAALDVKKTNAANALNSASQNAGNELNAQGLRVQGATGGANVSTSAGQAGTSALGVGATTAGIKADIGRAVIAGETVQQNAEQAANERLVKFGATAASGATGSPAPAGSTSDERAKTDVRAISDQDLLDFGASLKAASGRYKPGIEDGGKELHAFHPSAQELEKNPIGRMFVNEQPSGLKQIAYGPEAALVQSALIRELKRKGVL